jgi:hypothetical protein
VFWARFDPNGVEVEGGCVHPITGGSGDFTPVTGVLNKHDFRVGTELRTTYVGTIAVNAARGRGAPQASKSETSELAVATADSQDPHPSAC